METKLTSKNIGGDFYIPCPHCAQVLYIEKIKCGLFLHAFNIRTQKNLNPHSKIFYIEKIKREGNLGGCGGKFKILVGKFSQTIKIEKI